MKFIEKWDGDSDIFSQNKKHVRYHTRKPGVLDWEMMLTIHPQEAQLYENETLYFQVLRRNFTYKYQAGQEEEKINTHFLRNFFIL